MSRPVLADPTVAIEGVETRQLQPAKPGDLFAGSQITLFGRYAGEGKAKITLTGTVNGKKQELSYDAVFPANNADNAFIPRLWATRRVGFLLDEIRLHGEDKELKDEVLKLSREFGILTPYTSYLVLEPGKEQVSRGGGGEPLPSAPAPLEGHWAAPSAGARPKAERSAGAPVFAAPGERDREVFRRALGGAYDASFADADGARASNMLRLDSGESAVAQSEALTRYKYADRVDERSVASFRTVGKKMFYLLKGVWTDRDYRPEMVERRVKYAGDEYFKLLKEHPELKSCFSLGERVIVCLDEKTAVIVEAGE
jgi:Ca-activated chloride channel family protein